MNENNKLGIRSCGFMITAVMLLLHVTQVNCMKTDEQKWSKDGLVEPVIDVDGVLTGKEVMLLERDVKSVLNGDEAEGFGIISEACGQGVAIAVVLVRRPLHSYLRQYQFTSPAQAAQILHDKLGVGSDDAACGGNGLLLLIALNERAIEFSSGRSAKSMLPDQFLARVIDKMKPQLRAGQIFDAVSLAVRVCGLFAAGRRQQVANILGSIDINGSDKMDLGALSMFTAYICLFVLFIGINFVRQRRQTRSWNKCLSLLKEIEKLNDVNGTQDSSESGPSKYATKMCSICMEEFADVEIEGEKQKDKDVALRRVRRVNLDCGHSFCMPCLTEWFKIKSTCPLCRKECKIVSGGLENVDQEPKLETESLPWYRNFFLSRQSGTTQQNVNYNRSNGFSRNQTWMEGLVEDYGESDGGLFLSSSSPSSTSRLVSCQQRAFQLRRLRRLYPNFIDTGMINRLSPTQRLSRELTFLDRCPQVSTTRSRSQSSGFSYSSSSFSGGSCRGGGGASGRW